jgi:hypothetical protein
VNGRELRALPALLGEAALAMDALPGAAPLAFGFPYAFLRGATAPSTGYTIDGVTVPRLFHVAGGPPVVSRSLVERVEVFHGAYPAELGGRVGGAVVTTLRGPATDARAEGRLRLYDAAGAIASPWLDGRASAFAAGRGSFTGAALAIAAPDTRAGYWDYQAGASYALSRRDRVTALALGGGDHLGVVEGGRERALFDSAFHRVAIRLDHDPSRGGDAQGTRARLVAAVGLDRDVMEGEGVATRRSIDLASDVTIPLGSKAIARGGARFSGGLAAFEPTSGRVIDDARTTGALGAYADVLVRATRDVDLVPGLRVDVLDEAGDAEATLDPRAALRVRILPWLAGVGAVGIAHQAPTVALGDPPLERPGLGAGLARAVQTSAGVEVGLPEKIALAATFFHHAYDDLPDLAATCSVASPVCSLDDRAEGRSIGLEALVMRPLSERLAGFAAYTLSRTVRTAGGQTFLSDFDRTHVLHAGLSYQIGGGVTASARFAAYSGRPRSIVARDDPDRPEVATIVGRRNVLRDGALHRLDLRVEKRWEIGDDAWVSVILEGTNVTASGEAARVDCRAGERLGARSGFDCGVPEVGPLVLPSLGIAGGL